MLCKPILTGVLAMSVLVGQNALFANGGLLLTQPGLYNVDDSQSKNRKRCPYSGGDHEGYFRPVRIADWHDMLFRIPNATHSRVEHIYSVRPDLGHMSRLSNTSPSGSPLDSSRVLTDLPRVPRLSNTSYATPTSRSNAATGTGASKAIGAGAAGAAAGVAALFRRKKNDNEAQA